MEDLPLGRISALVPEFAVKDLPLGRTLMVMKDFQNLFCKQYISISFKKQAYVKQIEIMAIKGKRTCVNESNDSYVYSTGAKF